MTCIRFNFVVGFIVCPLLFSCGKIPSADPAHDSSPVSLLTGECLLDNKLSCIYSNSAGNGTYFRFAFSLNVDTEYEILEQGHNGFHVYPLRYRFLPSKSVFQQFQGNAEKVKEQYDSVWNSLNYSQSTIFSKGEMSLIADKEFAGIPAGENIAVLLESDAITRSGDAPALINIEPFKDDANKILLLVPTNTIMVYGPSNNIDDYNMNELEQVHVEKQAVVSFRMPASDCVFVDEIVSFSLEIPIRSAQYLNWINDNLSGEEMMKWKDDILTCHFQSNVRLHK